MVSTGMYRPRTMLVVLLLAGLLVSACGGTGDAAPDTTTAAPDLSRSPTATFAPEATSTRPPTPTFAPTFTPTAISTPEPTPTLEPTPVPLARHGTGNASVAVNLTAGLTVVTMRHYGKKLFEVRLRTASGDPRGQLARDQGAFQGSRAIAVKESGPYVVDISADGAWELEVMHPIPSESVVRDLPMAVSGTGVQAVYFVKAPPGLHTVTVSHDGQHAFIVSVMNSNARAFDRLIDTSGAFSGTAALSVRNEPFDYLIIDIRADGNWTLAMD